MAQPQHLHKQPLQRLLLLRPKPAQSPEVWLLVGRHHPEAHVLFQRLGQAPRAAKTSAVGIQQDGDHPVAGLRHGGVEGSRTPPIVTIGGVELPQVHLLHRIQDEPGQVALT